MKTFALKHRVLTTVILTALIILLGAGALLGITAINDSPSYELSRLFGVTMPEGSKVIHHSVDSGYINDGFLKHICYALEIEIPADKYAAFEAEMDEYLSDIDTYPVTEGVDHPGFSLLPNGIPDYFEKYNSEIPDMEHVRSFVMGVYESYISIAKYAYTRIITVARDADGDYHLFVYTY